MYYDAIKKTHARIRKIFFNMCHVQLKHISVYKYDFRDECKKNLRTKTDFRSLFPPPNI